MPLLLECDCGKRLNVPDEHAGKRVKCPACSQVLTVPGGRPDAPAGGMVRFTCACGRAMRARAEYAGQVVRCPACRAELEVPGPRRAAGREAASRIRADRPERARPAA